MHVFSHNEFMNPTINSNVFDSTLQAMADALYDEARQYLASIRVAEPTPVCIEPCPPPASALQRLLTVERALIEAQDRGQPLMFGRLATSLLGPQAQAVFVEVQGQYRFAGSVATEGGALRLARKHLAEPLRSAVPPSLKGRGCFVYIDGAQ